MKSEKYTEKNRSIGMGMGFKLENLEEKSYNYDTFFT